MNRETTERPVVNCPQCLALPEPPTEKYRRPPRLFEPGQVNGFRNIVTETPYTHQLDRNATLAMYKLRQRTSCIFGHPHKEGSIVQTRCGLVMRLGHVCAAKHVGGYEALVEFERERERHLDLLQLARTIPKQCENQLATLLPELKRAADYQRARRSTAEGSEMSRRAALGARGAEVIVVTSELDPNIGRRRKVERAHQLAGLEFWTTDFDLARASRAIAEASALSHEVRALNDDNDLELAALVRRCKALQTETNRVAEYVDLANRYMSRSNRALITRVMQGTSATSADQRTL